MVNSNVPTEQQIYDFIKTHPWTSARAVRDHFGQHGTKYIVINAGEFFILDKTTAEFYAMFANAVRRSDVTVIPKHKITDYFTESNTYCEMINTAEFGAVPYYPTIYAVETDAERQARWAQQGAIY